MKDKPKVDPTAVGGGASCVDPPLWPHPLPKPILEPIPYPGPGSPFDPIPPATEVI
jgi:hypothetical protein